MIREQVFRPIGERGLSILSSEMTKLKFPLSGGENPQEMTNYAKNFVELANRRYAEVITKKHRDNLAAQERAQLQRIREAEERQAMLERIAGIQL